MVGGGEIAFDRIAVLVDGLDRTADQLELGRLQGFVLALAGAEVTVEADHELGGGEVVDGPQAGGDGTGAGDLEGAAEAHEALAAALRAESGDAGGEDDEVGVEAAAEDFPGLQDAVVVGLFVECGDGEGEEGVEGDLRVGEAVGREVDDARLAGFGFGALFAGVVAQMGAHGFGWEETADLADFAVGAAGEG